MEPCLFGGPPRQSFFDAEGLETRELPSTLSESARRAVEATEVQEAQQLRVAELRCGKSTVHGWGLFAGDLMKGDLKEADIDIHMHGDIV